MFTWTNKCGGAFATWRVEKLLAGVSLAALAAGGLVASPAAAATYLVSTPAQLQQAIINANASPDASSTIKLTNSFTLPSNTTLPMPTKLIAIDTQGFVLSGSTSGGNNGINFGTNVLLSGALTVNGAFVGGNSGSLAVPGAGLNMSSSVGSTGQVTNNGSISGGNALVAAKAGGVGVFIFNDATLVNNGSISGGTANTYVRPVGGIQGSGVALGSGSTLINNVGATVQGGNSQGIGAGAGLDMNAAVRVVTATNYGTIRGGSDLTGTVAGNAAVRGRSGTASTSSLTNFGLLEGGNGAAAIAEDGGTWNLAVINSGIIRAGAGQTNAIVFGTGASASTLELQAGSIIEGNVVAGAGVNDVFRLGGTTNSTFDVSTIGPLQQYRNFDTLQKTGSSTWALTGDGTNATPWEVVAGTLQIGNGGTSGSIASNVTNNATLAFNRSDALTYGGAISGTGVVNQVGSGTTILTGANTYTGATNINAGTLRINGNQTGATGLTSVFAGGTLGGTGILGGDLTAFAGGTIAPGNSIGVLTVNGNYISNGGTLAVEAQLGGDGSPRDLLLINGNSLLGLAPTLVEVTNVGGLGGVATNGIKIVDVVGVSNAGVFVLSGPAIGGAYSYNLFQNDLATGTDGDWYLRSTGVLAPTTPTFENYPVALLGMTELPTLRQRVGDRVEAADGVWSRIEGGAGHYQASNSSTGASYDSSLFLAQIGVEGALIDGEDGSLVAGFSAQYNRNSAAVASPYGNGSNLTEGMGLGASLTWRGAEGTYLDLQGQLARFWTDLDAIGYRLVSDNGGMGLAVSLEAGHEIVLDDAWSITPQAQLSYASVGFDSFTDRFGSMISLEAGNSLKGRLGVAVDYQTDWQDERGRDAAASAYGVAGLTYEFLDGATVAVSGTNLHYAAQKFGAELGLGGTLEWNGGAQALHAELLGATSFQGSYGVKGTAGFTAGF